MSFNIGDRVKVVAGGYVITENGSFGIIAEAGHGSNCLVCFEYLTPGGAEEFRTRECHSTLFPIYIDHLELMTPANEVIFYPMAGDKVKVVREGRYLTINPSMREYMDDRVREVGRVYRRDPPAMSSISLGGWYFGVDSLLLVSRVSPDPDPHPLAQVATPSVQVGDLVRIEMPEGQEFNIAKNGSVGIVERINGEYCWVKYQWIKSECITPGFSYCYSAPISGFTVIDSVSFEGMVADGFVRVNDVRESVGGGFFVGDVVRVINDGQYTITTRGSIGIIVGVEMSGRPIVHFTWLPSERAGWSISSQWQYGIYHSDLEKVTGSIDPAAMRGAGFASREEYEGRSSVVTTGQVATVSIPTACEFSSGVATVSIPTACEFSSGESEAPPPPEQPSDERIQELLSRKLATDEEIIEVAKELGTDEATIKCYEGGYVRLRDKLRVSHGYFTPIQEHERYTGKEVPEDEFLHLSKCKTMVSYASSDEKRKADVWTLIKYGRFLAKFHPEMDNEVVKKAVNDFNYAHSPDIEVKISEKMADFIRVINEGPSESCQSQAYHEDDCGDENWFAGHIHPAAVYAAGDIQIAWLENNGRIVARTLINKGTKKFSRAYGDHHKLKPLLEERGYKQENRALEGCRLLKIENELGPGHIMCYVDAGIGSGGGSLNFKDGGEYWILTRNGGSDTYCGYEDRGLTEGCDDDDDSAECDRCGNWVDRDTLEYIESEERDVCPHCRDEYYTYAIVNSRGGMEYVPDDQAEFVECMGEIIYLPRAFEIGLVYDDHANEYIKAENAVGTHDGDTAHVDDVVSAGTIDGSTIYIHEDKLDDHELYRDSTGALFHEDSDEVQKWLDTVGEEDHDPDAYELVDDDLVVAQREEPVPAPEVKPVEDLVPVDIAIILHKMQDRGVRFLYERISGVWKFNARKDTYSIDHSHLPANWQEIFAEAQKAGVRFKSRYGARTTWVFDDEYDFYQLDL